ncbi:3-phosphoshikimate 1-carboxyvinyltransferase [Caldichromatium japonicum]|uniref:3-phosphoshikimate 1-carboxyvinyltransferase n=1 Tax=Caldichromatium japonicum TaxID=2699430 RepID=A0A6G7VBI9_9GAMM|nr:3-phosphoshikimate 1-carboxyvinyltransferase [Caldichromatium japonicum]QIK37381.1 3-phosphoshikimate 1-carboxyvinyltransferase [Caldichromatium japonicum]
MSARPDHRFFVAPGGSLRGYLRVPGDKSISHRAIMLASLAEGQTQISGFLEGADSLATLAAFRAMGVPIEGPKDGEVIVEGVGMQGLQAPSGPLDMGNSGTAMRLLAGLLAGQRFPATLIGDESLSRRPMRRVVEPLTQMGACIQASPSGTAPLLIEPTDALHGIEYRLPMASAQVKSCLMLAGLYAQGETCIHEPEPTRDHTERMLTAFGYPVRRQGLKVCLTGGGRLRSCRLQIPTDISSAAFFLVGASIAPGSDLLLEEVGINPTRVGVINLLRAMGADIELLDRRMAGGEPVADIRVKAAPLHGIEIPAHQVPLAIDEFPALFIAAACAQGETVLRGAAELRVKESDRIQVMADGLNRLGIKAESLADGIRIQGGQFGSATADQAIDAHGDHRIAMSFAIAALRAQGPIEIRDCANVETSFPGFAQLAARAGLGIEEQRQ